jgi:hypothetical protein
MKWRVTKCPPDLLEVGRKGPGERVVDVLARVVGRGAFAEVAGVVFRARTSERVHAVLALATVEASEKVPKFSQVLKFT